MKECSYCECDRPDSESGNIVLDEFGNEEWICDRCSSVEDTDEEDDDDFITDVVDDEDFE